MAPSILLVLLAIQVLGVISDYDGEKMSLITRQTAQCNAFADVVFLLERGASMGSANFTRQQEFAANITSQLPSGQNGVNFGAIVYGYEPETVFELGNQTDQAAIEAIMAVPYEEDCPREDQALKLARDQFLSPADGGRYWVPTVVILVTDLQSCAGDIMSESQLLNDKGVQIIAVGVGPIAQDVSAVATSSDDFFAVNSFDELATVQDEIVAKICAKGITKQTVRYSLVFKTANEPYANTDDNVFAIIQGAQGDTKTLGLDQARIDNFLRGGTDKYQFDEFDVGTITGIHMNVERGDGLLLDDAYIYKYLTDAQKLKAATDTLAPTYEECYFKGNGWIDPSGSLALQSKTLKE